MSVIRIGAPPYLPESGHTEWQLYLNALIHRAAEAGWNYDRVGDFGRIAVVQFINKFDQNLTGSITLCNSAEQHFRGEDPVTSTMVEGPYEHLSAHPKHVFSVEVYSQPHALELQFTGALNSSSRARVPEPALPGRKPKLWSKGDESGDVLYDNQDITGEDDVPANAARLLAAARGLEAAALADVPQPAAPRRPARTSS